jgi:peptidoglycan/LPS O-acetylase OafA/YrhL
VGGHAEKNRIPELDSFRTLAIASVILYHFYWSWTRLPATSRGDVDWPGDLFSFGFLGVKFFFVISGFVIAATLGNTRSFAAFWKKRAIRLLPAMVLCSLITLLFFNLVQATPEFERSQRLINFFYSLTFVDPALLNLLLAPLGIVGTTLSPSYWSLWPEIQFYLLVSCLHFIDPGKFYLRFIYTAMFIILAAAAARWLSSPEKPGLSPGSVQGAFSVITLPTYLHWFAAGVLFHGLWSGRRDPATWLALSVCIVFMLSETRYVRMGVYIGTIVTLFFLLVFRRDLLRPLRARWLAGTGAASYGLYLIHENIGQWLIIRYSHLFGVCSVVFPLLTAAGLVAFSLLLYYFAEAPLSQRLKPKVNGDRP